MSSLLCLHALLNHVVTLHPALQLNDFINMPNVISGTQGDFVMAAVFGEWIAPQDNKASTLYHPQIDPAMVDDERFPALLAAASGIDFSEAVALVTGASNAGSIGYQIALNFARGGAKVVITGSRNIDQITATAEQLIAEAGAGAFFQLR